MSKNDREYPLVTVAIPTYNRPEGLKKTLAAVSSQDYQSMDILVSDNGSSDGLTQNIVAEFASKDQRIRYFRHEKNQGIFFNFYFGLKNSKGRYFMWAADDDKWIGTSFLSNLMDYAPHYTLTFPDAIVENENLERISLLRNYLNCATSFDYLKAFCSTGWGHPLYGVYNLDLLSAAGLEFKLSEDLSYYMEGEFLHKVFLNCTVKYVPSSQILYDLNSTKPAYEHRYVDFLKYFKRTIILYSESKLNSREKEEVISLIVDTYMQHAKDLILQMQDNRISQSGVQDRIKQAIKILITGKIY